MIICRPVTLGWRCMLLLQLGYTEPSLSEESDCATGIGTAAGHLPWLTGTMWFISCGVPLSSSSQKDFSRAWLWCLHSTHLCSNPFSWYLHLQIMSMGSHHGMGFKHVTCTSSREQERYFTL